MTLFSTLISLIAKKQTDAELGWRHSVAPVNSPALSGLPRINSNNW
jgi:hypothetical protein